MRRNATEAEKRLWPRLRNRRLDGFKFVRQRPIGTYIVDFACPSAKLVIELDGSQHAEQASRDETRSGYLNNEGWEVLRFWNGDMLDSPDYLCSEISSALRRASNK